MREPIIVVEGRDDQRAVLEALPQATVVCTHGFGISEETWMRLETAAKQTGIVVLTDPDRAGEEIRRRIRERFPDALHAFLERHDATKNGDVGIENAAPEAIREALRQAKVFRPEAACDDAENRYTIADLDRYGLAGGPGAQDRRRLLGKMLGIGYGNAKSFLTRLNGFGIERKTWEEAAQKVAEKLPI